MVQVNPFSAYMYVNEAWLNKAGHHQCTANEVKVERVLQTGFELTTNQSEDERTSSLLSLHARLCHHIVHVCVEENLKPLIALASYFIMNSKLFEKYSTCTGIFFFLLSSRSLSCWVVLMGSCMSLMRCVQTWFPSRRCVVCVGPAYANWRTRHWSWSTPWNVYRLNNDTTLLPPWQLVKAWCRYRAPPLKSAQLTTGQSHIYMLYNDILDWIHWTIYYSSPSLTGHSQHRSPSIMRPQILPLLLGMHLLLPLTKDHLSNVTTISWQIGWPY